MFIICPLILTLHKIHNVSEMFLKTMHRTAAHLKDALFNLIAMLKNLRCCTFFITLQMINDYHLIELSKYVTVFFLQKFTFNCKIKFVDGYNFSNFTNCINKTCVTVW